MELAAVKKLGLERKFILDSEELASLAKIESAIIGGFRKYCERNNFVEILAPHLTSATGACENFLTLFSVEYFNKKAYLAQTGQLYLEAFVPTLKKTFCVGPSFRKEPKADSRHLVEFPLLEIEIADIDLNQLKNHIEGIFDSIIINVSKYKKELELFDISKEWLKNFKPPYKAITYKQAINSLKNYDLCFGSDLRAVHEQKLVELNGNKPLFVTHYPQEIKFFNMKLNRKDQKIVNSADLLLPYGGEAVGAAEREENFVALFDRFIHSEMLDLMCDAVRKENKKYAKMQELELKQECYKRFQWYFNLIEKRPVKHAGCGIGLNRITQSILKSNDIRYSTVYYLNSETLL